MDCPDYRNNPFSFNSPNFKNNRYVTINPLGCKT